MDNTDEGDTLFRTQHGPSVAIEAPKFLTLQSQVALVNDIKNGKESSLQREEVRLNEIHCRANWLAFGLIVSVFSSYSFSF